MHRRRTIASEHADLFEDLKDFLTRTIRTDRGAFTFAGYEPLGAICRELVKDHEQIDVVKPTQRGFTTAIGFGYGLWQVVRAGRNVGYFLPTNAMASGILKSRFSQAVEEAELEDPLEVNIGRGLVQYGGRRMLWLGLETVRNAISWPLDINIYDEVDDLNQDNMLLAQQRLDASEYAREVAFACGRYPGEGIHGRYLGGDQRRWVVRCAGCRSDQIPEDHFPDNVVCRKSGWKLVCASCGKPLDVARGRFVPQRTEGVPEGRVSFQVSSLAFSSTDLGRLMRLWQRAEGSMRERAAFRSSKLALPDAGDRQALSGEILSRALRPRPVTDPPFYAGVDMGDRCHIAVCGTTSAARNSRAGPALQFVHFESVKGEDLPGVLRGLHRTFDFQGILVDQKPEGSLARRICREFPDVAALQEFTDHRVGEDVKELDGETFRRISMPREDSIGSLCDQITGSGVLFPAQWDGLPFVESEPGQHLLTGSQRVEKTDRNGLRGLKFRWGNVENHYLMACVFAAGMARRQLVRVADVRSADVSERVLSTAELCGTAGSRSRLDGYDD